MADTTKTLKVKVIADTSGMVSVEQVAANINKEFDKTKTIQRLIAKAENERVTSIVLAQAAVANLNRTIASTKLKETLGSKIIAETNKELDRMQAKLQAIKNGVNLGTGNLASSVRETRPVGGGAASLGNKQVTPSYTTSSGYGTVSGGSVSVASNGSYIGVADARASADAMAKNTAAVKVHGAALDELIPKHKSLVAHITEVVSVYTVLNTTLNLVKDALLNIPAAGIRMQQTQASITAIFGGADGAKNLRELKSLAISAGQSLADLETSYRSFAPSAMLAGASQEQVNTIFKNFSETATVLHLTTDQTKSLYLALEQMYAKTTIQSEEIKKQLGNVLPGAVEIGAKAWAKYSNAQDKTVAGFMAAMKKNLVITKEFAPAFAEEYRSIFGGVKDSVFNDVRTKLYSNLQRIKTDYEVFSRGIFSLTEEVMNSSVKVAASALETVNSNLQGITQSVQALSVLVAASGLKSFASWAAASTVLKGTETSVNNLKNLFITLGNRLSILGVVFNPFVAGVGAAVAGLTTLAGSTTDVTLKYDKFVASSKESISSLMATYAAQGEGAQLAGEMLIQLRAESNSFFVEFEGRGVTLGSIFDVAIDNIGVSFSQLWTRMKEGFTVIFTGITEGLSGVVKGFYGMVRDSLEALGLFIDNIKARFIATRTYFEEFGSGEAVKKSFEAYDAAIKEYNSDTNKQLINFDNLTGKASSFFSSVGEDINSLSAKANKSVSGLLTEALAPIKGTTEAILQAAAIKQAEKDSSALDKLKQRLLIQGVTPGDNEPGTKGKDAGSKGVSKGIKDDYNSAMEAIKTATENTRGQIADYINEIGLLYKENSLSISDYFTSKGALQQADIVVQRQALEEELKLAFAQKDKVKISKLNTELQKLENTADKQAIALTRERTTELKAYAAVKVELANNILKSQGKSAEADVLDYYTANKEKYAKLEAEGDERGRQQLNDLGIKSTALASISKIEEDRSRANEEYNASLNRTNVLYNIGAISQLQAAVQTTQANSKHIAELEELIRKEKEIQDNIPAYLINPAESDKLVKLRNELGNLKLEADAVGQFIQQKLGGAFDSSFASFVSGSQTASQAFQSFAQDVVKGIGEIIAQELRSALFAKGSGLLSSVLSGIGGATGSIGSGGNSAAFTSSMNNLFTGFKAANGVAGTGLSAASGTILTSPTYFPNARVIPFANGGIVAGEAGAETVLPLKRGRNGKLGVSAESGQANVTNIFQVTVQHSGKESGDELGSKVAEAMMRSIAKKEIASASRPQNSLNRTTKVA